ncbi:unnamed protein product [Auanema sp. JU1783]|nr:unnamed protein product [Auanema sp. JU1783]
MNFSPVKNAAVVKRGKRPSLQEEVALNEQIDSRSSVQRRKSSDFLNVPGVCRSGAHQSGNDNEMSGSRVTFSQRKDSHGDIENESVELTIQLGEPEKKREQWRSKSQYYMAIISYAVGLGNVWRFPYLCQKNGGGAFMIPYVIMMGLLGLPLFLIELGIGQRLRTGPVGVWNAIHPYLGGIGVSAAVVSYLVALYYNVIITWCLYYLGSSFAKKLPWAECPKVNDSTYDAECMNATSPTMYFWSRVALDTTGSISEIGGINIPMVCCLFLAWGVVYLCVMKGIKTSGYVMYVTATFPYLVTTLFFVRSISLEGSVEGLLHMFKPDLTKLYNPTVWLEAATQIFYSMGLGFGGLIAFGSYNPVKNNVIKDVVQLGIVNGATSVYTAAVVFSVLGYMAHNNMNKCVTEFLFSSPIMKTYNVTEAIVMISNVDNYQGALRTSVTELATTCNYDRIISEAAEGTGLAFVVFTEAMLHFPFPPIWSVLFFLMLLSLGLGSMFGTLEGVITSLNDSKMVKVSKPVLTFWLCASALTVGLLFTTRSGQYWVSLFDSFAGSYALMCVAFSELMSVVYVYGYMRFVCDLEYMTGIRPGIYWLIMWRFVSPSLMFTLFSASIAQCFNKPLVYFAYDSVAGKNVETEYPVWAMFLAVTLIMFALLPTFGVFFLRYFKIWKIEADIPAKALGKMEALTSVNPTGISN